MFRLMFLSAVAAAATALTVSAARADELGPIEGRSVHLGTVSGIVYFVPRGSDDHIVATLNVGGDTTPVRFETSLSAGQSAVVSVPRGVGEPPIEVTFHRQGDRMIVSQSDAIVN